MQRRSAARRYNNNNNKRRARLFEIIASHATIFFHIHIRNICAALIITQEIKEKLERKRAKGQLPHQRVQRLVQAFTHPVPLPREPTESVVLKYNQRLQLTCPEILDQTYRFEGRRGCPDEDLESKNPKRYGLLLAATISHEEIVDAGVNGIEDGCPLACTPRKEAVARSVFMLRKVSGVEKEEEECLCFGQEFYLQVYRTGGGCGIRS